MFSKGLQKLLKAYKMYLTAGRDVDEFNNLYSASLGKRNLNKTMTAISVPIIISADERNPIIYHFENDTEYVQEGRISVTLSKIFFIKNCSPYCRKKLTMSRFNIRNLDDPPQVQWSFVRGETIFKFGLDKIPEFCSTLQKLVLDFSTHHLNLPSQDFNRIQLHSMMMRVLGGMKLRAEEEHLQDDLMRDVVLKMSGNFSQSEVYGTAEKIYDQLEPKTTVLAHNIIHLRVIET